MLPFRPLIPRQLNLINCDDITHGVNTDGYVIDTNEEDENGDENGEEEDVKSREDRPYVRADALAPVPRPDLAAALFRQRSIPLPQLLLISAS